MHESTCRLPYEIVEMITAHLIHDLHTLKACSLTCRCWYSAAAALIHHTLTLTGSGRWRETNQLELLSKLHKLGLVPLVREIRMRQFRGESPWLVPWVFDDLHLRYFSTFSNVHTLKLQEVDLNPFIPGIERYFKHLSPALRSITLLEPWSTPRRLSYFLSLFTNLDDIIIRNTSEYVLPTTIPDTELVLFSKPKLQGRLLLDNFRWADTWTHLITWCGGLRFHYMSLRRSGGSIPILLEACSESLETLRINTMDGKFCAGSPTDSN